LAANGFDEFRQLVLSDRALQQDLLQAVDERSLFDKVLARGRERGYAFSEQDLEAAVRINRRGWLERWLYQ
jgi:hypothetical protein